MWNYETFGRKHRRNSYDLILGKELIDITAKPQSIEEKTDQWT